MGDGEASRIPSCVNGFSVTTCWQPEKEGLYQT